MTGLILFLTFLQTDGQNAQLVAALRKLNSVQVAFRQHTYSDFMDDTTAEGMLKITRPGKLHMIYSRGEQKEFICDGVTYYEKDLLADTESRVPFTDLKNEPLVRLLLFGDDPEKHFQLDNRHVADVTIYRLRPLDDPSYYIELTLDAQMFPKSVEVYGEDGEGTRFSFSQWQLVPQFPAGEFIVPKNNKQDSR